MDLFADDPPPPADPARAEIDPSAPLAERMRPRTLDDIVGHDALLAAGRPLREAIDHDRLRSIILWGRPARARPPLPPLTPAPTRPPFTAFSPGLTGIKEPRKLMP